MDSESNELMVVERRSRHCFGRAIENNMDLACYARLLPHSMHGKIIYMYFLRQLVHIYLWTSSAWLISKYSWRAATNSSNLTLYLREHLSALNLRPAIVLDSPSGVTPCFIGNGTTNLPDESQL